MTPNRNSSNSAARNEAPSSPMRLKKIISEEKNER
jgi:hypothetical protein